jgi:large conductance mechanosensitive channel
MHKIKKVWSDFKSFISKGSVLDLAVGVIIAGAFNAIISSLVNDLFMPIITIAIPGGLTGLVTVLNGSSAYLGEPDQYINTANYNTVEYWGNIYNSDIVNVINWGDIINKSINFIIIAFVLFVFIRVFAAMKETREQNELARNAFTFDERKAMLKNGLSILQIEKLAKEKVKKDLAVKSEENKAASLKIETEISLLHDIKALLEKQNIDASSNINIVNK